MIHSLLRPRVLFLSALVLPSLAPAQENSRGFLGVHVVPVPAEVRAQTDLADDAGLLIDFLQPGSPAEKAGVIRFDVLVKFSDQRILHPDQFATLVRNAKPGQELDVTVLRKNREIPLKVTLGSAPAAPPESPAPPERSAESDRLLVELLQRHPDGRRLLQEMLKTLRSAEGNPAARSQSHRQISRTDSEGCVEITEHDGAKTARVKGVDGKIQFEGPVSTEEQRKGLPEGIRARIESLEESAGSIGKQ